MAQDPTPPFTAERLSALAEIPLKGSNSPGYVVHLDLLEQNCRLLSSVSEQSGAKILLALKGFACHSTFPVISSYLSGTTSSGLHEALLAREFFGKEIHVYSPAFKTDELETLTEFAHTLVFNSPQQLTLGIKTLGDRVPEIGLRVNPEYSEVETELYDPCASDSVLFACAVNRSASSSRRTVLSRMIRSAAPFSRMMLPGRALSMSSASGSSAVSRR